MYKNSMLENYVWTLWTGKEGEHMNEELLTRLVDALEGINSNLSEIAVSLDSLDKTLNGCVSVSQNGKSRYLCISGDIYTN